MTQGKGITGTECIRQATPQDIEALVDIYIESFPERVEEVFGGPQRRVFIRDYLLFCLAWDPPSNWVYVKDSTVVGFVMIPCQYSLWRTMLERMRLLHWIAHFLTGAYGFPLHLMRQFFSDGFAFAPDPAIKRLQGKPYIHLIAVKGADGKEPSRGLLGIGRQLLQWALADHWKKGVHFCWAMVQPTGTRFIPIWKRMGFKICPISNGYYLALWGDEDEDLSHSEG